MKYYAVKKGKKPGIYTNWNDCRDSVTGFSEAEYKSFKTEDEAKEYMELETSEATDINFSMEDLFNMIINDKEVTAFVDGSFENGKYSFGLVAIGLHKIHEDFCLDFEPGYVEMRNVAGELLGSIEAMEYCIKNNVDTLNLYYDYEGIAKWALDLWKCNKPGTQAYKKYYDSIKDKLKVNFVKVRSHTGIVFNERADYLAKKALGLVD